MPPGRVPGGVMRMLGLRPVELHLLMASVMYIPPPVASDLVSPSSTGDDPTAPPAQTEQACGGKEVAWGLSFSIQVR
eukprot:3914032-Rhodomonas_salina.1